MKVQKTQKKVMADKKNDFLPLTNEIKSNLLVFRFSLAAMLVFPFLLLGKYLGYYSGTSYKRFFAFFVIALFCNLIAYVATKFYSDKPSTKYICLIMLQIFVTMLSLDSGLEVYITYVMVPLVSLLYLKPKFSKHIAFISYVCMVGSIIYRSRVSNPYYSQLISKEQWMMAYTTGLSIEYIINIILVNIIEKHWLSFVADAKNQNKNIITIQNQVINAFANLIESKDLTTGKHVKRASEYVGVICHSLRNLGYYTEELDQHTIELMVAAAPLHDLGKISISDSILHKTGRLTRREHGIIQNHPIEGMRLITENMSLIEDLEYIDIARFMALFHHEHWDGTGYPFRLIGEEIPLVARIMTAADILDALLSERPFKRAYSLEESFSFISTLSGNCLEPSIVEAILAAKDEISKICISFADTPIDELPVVE